MPLIILDRDGVINYESNQYIKTPDEWLPLPGSLEAIAALTQANYQVVVATNQSGLGRGYFDLPTLEAIHHKMQQAVIAHGGKLADIFFCPHHPDEGCHCRKPQPGLLEQIAEKYALDLSQVFFVGDSVSDLRAAKSAGCKPLLVLTGNGQMTLTHEVADLVPHFSDLAQVAEFVIHGS